MTGKTQRAVNGDLSGTRAGVKATNSVKAESVAAEAQTSAIRSQLGSSPNGISTASAALAMNRLSTNMGPSKVRVTTASTTSTVPRKSAAEPLFPGSNSGGPAARLAQDCIRKVEVVEYPELGMEAIWQIEVENFPAFIIVDDKGNDFFASFMNPNA